MLAHGLAGMMDSGDAHGSVDDSFDCFVGRMLDKCLC